ncbi:hypothetical protein PSY29_23530, partial [Shigella flexneri]|nr:hypothetical protein [Shigella flexneri]
CPILSLSPLTLVTINPALIEINRAGFIVTRVNGDSDNMGRNIMSHIIAITINSCNDKSCTYRN